MPFVPNFWIDPNPPAQGANGTLPTLATEGIALTYAAGWSITVSADVGQSLSGAGVIRIYRYSETLGRWCHDIDLDMNPTAAGERDQSFPDVATVVCGTRVAAIPFGVTASGGLITTTIEVWPKG